MYLSLLVVGGAAPQTFAHSAPTRNFELVDEIEVKDDLDNQPDGCDATRGAISEIQTTFLWFNHRSVEEYSSLVESFLEAYPEDRFSTVDLSWTSADGERPFRKVDFLGQIPLDSKVTKDLNSEITFVANGLPGKEFLVAVSRNNGETSFRFESKGFRYDTPLVRWLYSKALDYYRCSGSLETAELIYKNTQVVVENNNLIISTRLARGSLDPLLSNNAK